MGGPGVDPGYNGTTGEAYAWGEAQAAHTLSDITHIGSRVDYPVIFMDVELPGNAPRLHPSAGQRAVASSEPRAGPWRGCARGGRR